MCTPMGDKYTHAHLWFPPLFLAVNHHNIKNWVPSILTHNLWLIFMRMKQRKIFFFWKKKSKWLSFSIPLILNIFFWKFQGLHIGPWASRINWCERHWCGSTYMVVWLSDISSKAGCFRAYVRQPDNHIGWATSMSFASIYPTNPRINSWNFQEKTLKIARIENLIFFESAILYFFFQNF